MCNEPGILAALRDKGRHVHRAGRVMELSAFQQVAEQCPRVDEAA